MSSRPSIRARSATARLGRVLDRITGPSIVLLILGLWISTRSGPTPTDDVQRLAAPHADGVVAFAQEQHHAALVVESGDTLRLLVLGRDPTRVADIEQQTLAAKVQTAEGAFVPIELVPSPQAGDRAGRTSQFLGRLPAGFTGEPTAVSVPTLRLGEARYRLEFPLDRQRHVEMPEKLLDSAERDLYLNPGGKYTAADIAANGRMTASQRYKGFQARHDANPQPGDLLCPITYTKADPSCTWTIDGSRYSFCCPPCIDEFLSLAKTAPDQVRTPQAYRIRRE
jgi:hypothetical protein